MLNESIIFQEQEYYQVHLHYDFQPIIQIKKTLKGIDKSNFILYN